MSIGVEEVKIMNAQINGLITRLSAIASVYPLLVVDAFKVSGKANKVSQVKNTVISNEKMAPASINEIVTVSDFVQAVSQTEKEIVEVPQVVAATVASGSGKQNEKPQFNNQPKLQK